MKEPVSWSELAHLSALYTEGSSFAATDSTGCCALDGVIFSFRVNISVKSVEDGVSNRDMRLSR